jgi:hypothetical protein
VTVRATAVTFALALAFRLMHANVLWVEEAYPAAGAINILAGRLPYLDFWYDKPPLTPFLYTLWGALDGLPLRIAGAAYVTLCAWLAARLAGSWIAGALLAFFLTFNFASAVLPLGPDLLTLAPVMAAVLMRDRPWIAGALIGVAFHFNVKAILFLPVVFSPRAALAFLAVAAPILAIPGYVEQVWKWGSLYARDAPAADGFAKTAGWLGFHAGLLLAALRSKPDRWIWLWLAAAAACAILGFRFFPRYYFHLLPPLCILAGRALAPPSRWRWTLALLAIPLIRFAPGYWNVERSRDLTLFRDAREAAKIIAETAQPGDTLFTWGYRPEIDALTRLPGGTPFLESQPLTGVFADRHLTSAKPSADGAARRARLAQSRPTFVVDGLARLNPQLSIANYEDLRAWLARYRVIALTRSSVIYRIRD